MKKLLSVLMVGIMALSTVSLVACGGDDTYIDEDGNVQKKTILRFFGWGSIEEQEIFGTMVEMFNEEYPQYKVEYEATSGNLYMNTLAGKKNNPRSMPDVFYLDDTYFCQWIYDSDIMLNLSPYIEKSETFSVDNVWYEAFNAYRFDPESKLLGTGNIYAMPKDVGPYALVYNKTAAKAKGVTIISDENGTVGYNAQTKTLNDQVSMTWAQFIRFCQDTQTGEFDDKDVIIGTTHYPLEVAYTSMGEGAHFLDSTRKQAQINTARYAEAAQFVADICNVYQCGLTPENQQTMSGYERFVSGRAVTTWCGPWNTPEMWYCDFDWDILPIPVPNESGDLTNLTEGARTGCKGVSYLGSAGLCVYSKSQHPDAAYLFAEYLSVNREAQRKNYKMGMAVPNLIDMAEGEFLTESLDDPMGMNRPQNRKVYLDIIENSIRRAESYTYSRDWVDEMWASSKNQYNLQRVWRKNPGSYGSHVDLWDYTTKAITADGQTFLSGLQGEVQKLLDKRKDKYNWVQQ